MVGMGTPAHGAAFKSETGAELPLLFSRDKSAYRAMDLGRASTGRVFHPRAVASGLRRRASFVAKAPEQDWHQLGGAFVIDTSGNVVFEHRSRWPGDEPDLDELAGALRRAT